MGTAATGDEHPDCELTISVPAARYEVLKDWAAHRAMTVAEMLGRDASIATTLDDYIEGDVLTVIDPMTRTPTVLRLAG